MARWKTMRTLQAIGHELKENPPAIVAHTRRRFGAKQAKRQWAAILLSKARKAGASTPRGA